MRITKLLFAAALTGAVAAPAFAADVNSFTADGDTYDYVATRAPNGVVRLDGHVQSTGQSFALRVRNRHVDGNVGVNPVSFDVSQETIDRLDTELASTGGSATAPAAN